MRGVDLHNTAISLDEKCLRHQLNCTWQSLAAFGVKWHRMAHFGMIWQRLAQILVLAPPVN